MTKTGNWKEVENLKQRGKSNKGRSSLKFVWMQILILITAVVLTIKILEEDYRFLIISIGTAMGFMIGLIHYFEKDSGSQYLIPKSNVVRLETDANSLTIHYINADGETNEEYVMDLAFNDVAKIKSLVI